MGIGEPQPTEVLKKCPYFTDIIDRFNGLLKCKVKMARLSALPPGGKIHRHYDRIESVDFGMWRIHIPITTHPKVKFYLGFRRRKWNPGEVWVGDFTFPHSIHNDSPINRVHMIIDLEHASERVISWLPKGHMSEKSLARRAWLRERNKWLDWQLDKIGGRKDRSGRRDTPTSV
jgi:aspartyl/asparaginyl beta-hydroxylase (cupin superfamily)